MLVLVMTSGLRPLLPLCRPVQGFSCSCSQRGEFCRFCSSRTLGLTCYTCCSTGCSLFLGSSDNKHSGPGHTSCSTDRLACSPCSTNSKCTVYCCISCSSYTCLGLRCRLDSSCRGGLCSLHNTHTGVGVAFRNSGRDRSRGLCCNPHIDSLDILQQHACRSCSMCTCLGLCLGDSSHSSCRLLSGFCRLCSMCIFHHLRGLHERDTLDTALSLQDTHSS